jgi:glucose-6-phosphate dehydrogenase assembly protein OpcA
MSEGNGRVARAAERELALHRRLMRFGEDDSRVAPLWSASGTSIPAIESHLAQLWTVPATAEADSRVTEKGLSHARASVLNLIVTVPTAELAERVVGTMLGLGFRHPSRAIVLVADPSAEGPTLDAAVSAHCHAKPGQADQVCYEEIVLTVRGDAAHHLDGVVAPLLIHDLPTHVWWPGDPPLTDPIFDQLLALSDRLIIDSSDFSDLLAGMRRLTNLRHQTGIGDLSWERLGWWQELTAQFFDAPRFRRYLPNLSRLIIRYAVSTSGEPPATPRPGSEELVVGCASPIAQAILYAGWIAARLTWRRYETLEPLGDGRMRLRLEGRHEMVDLQIEPVPTDELPAGELLSVRLRSYGETGAAEFIIDREGSEATVASNADGMTALLRRVAMEPSRESELLSTCLISDGHDALYEASLRAAAVFLSAARTPARASEAST